MPGYGPGGGITPQVAGAATSTEESPDLDDLQRQIDEIRKKINDIAGQLAALNTSVLGAAAMVNTGTGGGDLAGGQDTGSNGISEIIANLIKNLFHF